VEIYVGEDQVQRTLLCVTPVLLNRVNETFVPNFLNPLVTCIYLSFLPNTYHQSRIKWQTSSARTSSLQQSSTYHFRSKAVEPKL